MHVLIIPSEEFVPATNHTSGIFQYHQGLVLHEAGYKVGALSIRQEYSVPMILRAALSRLVGRRVGNALDRESLRGMQRLLRDKLAAPEKFIKHEKVGPISTVRIDGFYFLPPSPKTNHLGWVKGGNHAFRAYVEAYGTPDVIHAHNLDSAGLLANHIWHEFGIPYVVTEHSSTYLHRNLISRERFPALTRAARQASSFAAVSPGLARLVRRKLSLNQRDIEIIPNVIDPDFLTTPIAERTKQERFSFLCIGNLIPVKNHEMLIKSFNEAFANSPNVTLRIGGEGELRDALMNLVLNLGLHDRIEFLGRLDRQNVLRQIDDCDAFVLPSRYETFGVVLIEAMARGKPVVSTACGGPEAFVTKTDGEVVPNENQSALALALKSIVSRAKSYDAEDIRRRAVERFGPRALLAHLEPMYRRAVS